ncbi:MAG TPA: acyltransferase [Opitutaceae bacterium]|jgi:peptidoglycan/LPS O-acetylase OafA/YrhL|nr:acyltransferase [Opitutaceae bacterium]
MKGTQDRDLALEGVRGLCAMLVVFGHMTYQAPLLDPGFACDLLHVDYGPQAVFVFFVLSGYVIGLTTRTPATASSIRQYCSRRLLRIVPIAWIAIVLAWLVLRHDGLGTVVGNMLFLQNTQPYPLGLRVPVLYDDPPLWSLSFEMLYYGLFILVWKYRPRASTLFAAVTLVAFGDLVGLSPIFTRQAAYFAYWLVGLYLAWKTDVPGPQARSAWPASFAVAVVTWTVEPVHAVLDALSPRLAALDLDRLHLDVLAGSVLIVASAARRAPRLRSRLGMAFIAIGLAAVPIKGASGSLSYVELVGAAVLCGCILARNWSPSMRPLRVLAPVGVVSYALYATAYPLMRLLYRSPFLPSGSLSTFLLRAAILAVLSAASAVFLERIVQPRIVRWLKSALRLSEPDLPHEASSQATRS